MRARSLLGPVIAALIAACVGDEPAAGSAPGRLDEPAGDGGAVDVADGGGGPADADATPDAPVDAGPCDLDKPFGAPIALPAVNDPIAHERSFRLTADGLYGVLESTRSGGPTTLYTFSRASILESFGNATAQPALTSASAALLTPDGLGLYFVKGNSGSGFDLWFTSRATRGALFLSANAGTITSLASTSNEGSPWLTADGTRLYFSREAASIPQIWSASIEGGDYVEATRVEELSNTAGSDRPVLTGDGLTIYFSSARSDGDAMGGNDIWRAQRPSTTGSFGAPTNVAELNSPASDRPSWVSTDGCTIYLSTDRLGAGGEDIYVASRPK